MMSQPTVEGAQNHNINTLEKISLQKYVIS